MKRKSRAAGPGFFQAEVLFIVRGHGLPAHYHNVVPFIDSFTFQYGSRLPQTEGMRSAAARGARGALFVFPIGLF
jgi:hypothetical protein